MFEGFERGLDYALMIIMGYFFLRGIFRGVVKEIVAILGVFVAFWVAGIYWQVGDEHLKAIFDLPAHRGIVSFTMIFVVVYFLIGVISIFVDKIVRITISPIVSALLGAVLGPVKGILFCAVLLAGTETFIKPTEKFFTSSEFWPYIQPISQQAKDWLPADLRKTMADNTRSAPAISERYRSSQTNGPGSAPPQPQAPQIDWPAVKNLLATRPGDISQAWREKIRSVPSGQSLSEEDLKKFVADHPALFSRAPASPAGTKEETPEASPPSWPQPAE